MHADNFLIIAKYIYKYAIVLKEYFKLWFEDNINYFLKCYMKRKNNSLWVISAKTSIKKIISKIE